MENEIRKKNMCYVVSLAFFFFRFTPFWTRISLDNSLLFFEPWEPSSSLSWSLCTFLRLNSAFFNLRSVKASKVEIGGWGSAFQFYIEFNIWWKQRFYEIKLTNLSWYVMQYIVTFPQGKPKLCILNHKWVFQFSSTKTLDTQLELTLKKVFKKNLGV